jgi:hypothetical protein
MQQSIFFTFKGKRLHILVENMIDNLIKKNPCIKIKNYTDKAFGAYGKILQSDLFHDAFIYLNKLDIPKSGNVYIAHDEDFFLSLQDVSPYDDVFGQIPIQFGYVNGNNSYMNALEYHKSSEVNIAATPMVLLLGHSCDIENNTYDSSKLEAFYIPKNSVIEINAGVLHFSPCRVIKTGFKCGVILPKGTNVSFVSAKNKGTLENELLFKTNKWLLAHVDNKTLIDKGAHPGITGQNYKVTF